MRHPPIMTICSQSACCGHARLCICKHFSTQVHRWGVWACDHMQGFVSHFSSTSSVPREHSIHPLCMQLLWSMLEDGTPFSHSIIVLICRATARPSKGFNRTRQSNKPHSFCFILASLSLLWPSFFCFFFLPSFVSHWVHQRLEAYIAHNWNHGTNIHS